MGVNIEWDDKKDKENKRKHGISFDTASYVFADPYRLERVDHSENNPGEDRIQTLGLVGKVLFVVYTERKEAFRLISARVANKEERRIYYGHCQENNSDWGPAD